MNTTKHKGSTSEKRKDTDTGEEKAMKDKLKKKNLLKIKKTGKEQFRGKGKKKIKRSKVYNKIPAE